MIKVLSSHRPRKRFGQHFLRDTQVQQDILNAINPEAPDRILEIGPGQGVLTKHLLSRVPQLHAIEIDRDLITYLREHYSPSALFLHEGDVLKFDFKQFTLDPPDTKLRVVGNLPYNISTPLLFYLTQYHSSLQDAHFLLQKEVVDRMVAVPSTAAYGRLSVMIQYWFTVTSLFNVPPEAFYPPPKVQSSLVRLVPRCPLPNTDYPRLERLVASAFSQRRKMLRGVWAGQVSLTQMEACGIRPELRAEELSLNDYLKLTNRLCEDKAKNIASDTLHHH